MTLAALVAKVPLCHGMMRRSEHYRYGTGLPANLGLPLLEIIKRKNYQDIFRTIQYDYWTAAGAGTMLLHQIVID